MESMEGAELADRIGLVPILRAGLGMVDAMLELMPTAQVLADIASSTRPSEV